MTRTTSVRLRRSARHSSPWRIAARAAGLSLGIVVVVVALAIGVVPRLWGGTSLTVLSGSMEPVFSPGDVLAVRGTEGVDLCSAVSIGDIVTFLPYPDEPTLVTHRVVAKSIGEYDDGTECRFVTQGDANPVADDEISPRQIRGLLLWGVPGLGWARQWIGDNLQLAVIAVGAVIVLYGGWRAFDTPRRRVVHLPFEHLDVPPSALPAAHDRPAESHGDTRGGSPTRTATRTETNTPPSSAHRKEN